MKLHAMHLASMMIATMLSSLSWFVVEADDIFNFKRMSTFYICQQIDPTCNTDTETNAETIWYYQPPSLNTLCLVYTDSQAENLGFVDITDPESPEPDGIVPLGGEPTTVRVIGDYGTCDLPFSLVFSLCICVYVFVYVYVDGFNTVGDIYHSSQEVRRASPGHFISFHVLSCHTSSYPINLFHPSGCFVPSQHQQL